MEKVYTFKNLLKITKAIADETRLRILNILLNRELCVCEIQNVLNMSEPRISRHLRILKCANLIDFRKEGKWYYYRISNASNLNYLFKFFNIYFNDKIFLKDIEIMENANISCTVEYKKKDEN